MTNALIEPGTGGTFKIQAHFDKLNHYYSTDSKTIILKIRAEKPSCLLRMMVPETRLFRDMLRRMRLIPKRTTLPRPFGSLYFYFKVPIKFYNLLFLQAMLVKMIAGLVNSGFVVLLQPQQFL